MTMKRRVFDKIRVAPDANLGDLEPTRYMNYDLVPLPPARRTWTAWSFFGFFATININTVQWQAGSSLISLGLSVWEALIVVIIAKVLMGLIAVFDGYSGGEWHIGFTVVSRSVFGIRGMYLPLIQRLFLCFIWFGVQSWLGGLFMQVILVALFPSFGKLPNTFPASANMTTQQFIGFAVFMVLQLPLIYVPPEKTAIPFRYMNILSGTTMLVVTIWALAHAHGAGPLLTQNSTLTTSSERGWAMIKGITTVIGSLAVSLSNSPDFSRFAKTPGAQVPGQMLSSTVIGTLVPLAGILSTAACQKMYGTILWNPAEIFTQWMTADYSSASRAAAVFAAGGFLVSQMGINVVDNAWPGGFDLSGLFPQYINIRRGAYIASVICIAINPWQLANTQNTFINVLDAYSTFLGPLTGMYVADYWIVRRRKIKLTDLYHGRRDGIYFFWHGVNLRAFVSWIVGWAFTLPGFCAAIDAKIKVSTGATDVYYLAYLVGFVVSFVVHVGVNKVFPPKGLGVVDEYDAYCTFTPEQARKLGVVPADEPIHGRLVSSGTSPVEVSCEKAYL